MAGPRTPHSLPVPVLLLPELLLVFDHVQLLAGGPSVHAGIGESLLEEILDLIL